MPINNTGAARTDATVHRLSQPQGQVACQFLSTKEAGRWLGLSYRTLEDWRYKGGGPRFRKLGGAIRYAITDLQAFSDGAAFTNTGQIAA